MESATITPNPERKDAAIVAFTERYRAEQFLAAASKEIPHIGKCEVTWVPNAQLSGVAAATVSSGPGAASGTDGSNAEALGNVDVRMVESHDGGRTAAEVDYDVADDDERWMAG